MVKEHVDIEVKERSLHLNSSSIPKDHEVVLSRDRPWAERFTVHLLCLIRSNLSCPSLKLGPGDSLRSHTADEFIYEKEIVEGIDLYIQILKGIL